jgi:hypothetical protein
VTQSNATAHVNKWRIFVCIMVFIFPFPFVMNGLTLPRNEKQC